MEAVLKGVYPFVLVPVAVALAYLVALPPSPRVLIAMGLLCLLLVLSCFLYGTKLLGGLLAGMFLVSGAVGQAWRGGAWEGIVGRIMGPGAYLVDSITPDRQAPSYNAMLRGTDESMLVSLRGSRGENLVPGCLSEWMRLCAKRAVAVEGLDLESEADDVARSCPFVFLDTNPDKARQVLRQAFLAGCDDPAKMALVLQPVVTLHELAVRIEPDRQLMIPLPPELPNHCRGITASLAPVERRRDGAIKTPARRGEPHAVEVMGR